MSNMESARRGFGSPIPWMVALNVIGVNLIAPVLPAAPSLSLLLAARAIQGVGSALFGTSINRYLLVVTRKADFGKATAGFQGGILLGGTIGPLVGGMVAERFGIFAPFHVQATIAVALPARAAQGFR
jgi:MFS family permease